MKGNMIDTAKPGPTFDAESMRAILDGRKTQTRRLIKSEMLLWANPQAVNVVDGECVYKLENGCTVSGKLPYRVGGAYYARESLCKGPVGSFGNGTPDDECCLYAADGSTVTGPNGSGWSVHWGWKCRVLAPRCMPRWAARVFLRITDVRVQRLGEITADDAIAEGILPNPVQEGTWMDYPPGSSAAGWRDPRRSFESRWNQVNGKGSWERDRNRWVAAYTFETIKPEGV